MSRKGRAISVYIPGIELDSLEARGYDTTRLGPTVRRLLVSLPATQPSPSRPRRGRSPGTGEPVIKPMIKPVPEIVPEIVPEVVEQVDTPATPPPAIPTPAIPTPAIPRNVWIEE